MAGLHFGPLIANIVEVVVCHPITQVTDRR